MTKLQHACEWIAQGPYTVEAWTRTVRITLYLTTKTLSEVCGMPLEGNYIKL